MSDLQLLHDHSDLTRLLGENYLSRLVYPHIAKDGFKNMLPLAVVNPEGNHTILVRDGDAGITTFAPAGASEFRVYGRYFSFNDDPPAESLEQCLTDLVGARTLLVRDTLPVSLYRVIAEAGVKLKVTGNPVTGTLQHHTIERNEVTETMATGLDRYRDAAKRAVRGYRYESEIVRIIESARDQGFALLDEILEHRELSSLLVTSPFQQEELTGLPQSWLETAQAALLVRKGDSQVHLLTAAAGEIPGINQQGEFESLVDALNQLNVNEPAVEHAHAELRLLQDIGADPLSVSNASAAIHEWQELRAASQLPFYVLASNSARHALERTVAAAEERLSKGEELTESELARAFDAELGGYAGEYGLAGSFRPYFRIIHPGERTLVPAAPTDNPLSNRNRTIKFDMGTQVLDGRGRVRGCSDIARTICATDELKQFQDKLREILLERVIPAIRPGVTGAEVHAAATQALAEHDELFRSWGVLPEGKSGRDYARDCGHIINRQTICNIYFTPTTHLAVKAGMSGCVEFVWGVADLIIATEEAYVVTEDGAIPITA